MPKIIKCLFPECPRDKKHRGLCKTHYIEAQRLVKAGKTTWSILIKTNRAKPKQRRATKIKDFFLRGQSNYRPSDEEKDD